MTMQEYYRLALLAQCRGMAFLRHGEDRRLWPKGVFWADAVINEAERLREVNAAMQDEIARLKFDLVKKEPQ